MDTLLTLLKGAFEDLHRAFEEELVCLTFDRVVEQTWLNEIKRTKNPADGYLAEAIDAKKIAELAHFLCRPKDPLAVVLQKLVARVAKDLLCNGKGWLEFTGDLTTAIRLSIEKGVSSNELTVFIHELKQRLRDKLKADVLLGRINLNLAKDVGLLEDEMKCKFHEDCQKKVLSIINAQCGPSDLDAFSQRISKQVVQQLMAKKKLVLYNNSKPTMITKDNIDELLVDSSEEDTALNVVELSSLESVRIRRGLSRAELATHLSERCVQLTWNSECQSLTSAESFALGLVQHFTGQYFLDCLDFSKLSLAQPNLDEPRWNAFRIRLETYDFSNVTSATLDDIVDQVRQLFADSQKTIGIVCFGSPNGSRTYSNGQFKQCTRTRLMMYSKSTKRYEAIAALQDVYKDTESYFDALLRIYETTIRSHFKEQFDACHLDAEACEKLADGYREDIIKVGYSFDSWTEVFRRWSLADRLKVLTLSAERCSAQTAEEDLCEQLRRTVAACFKSESEDAWDRRRRIREEELHRATAQSLSSLEEIEQLQRQVAELNHRATVVDSSVAAKKKTLAWKMFLLKAASSSAFVTDYQLARERERHKLFRENSPIRLAGKLFEFAYPDGDRDTWRHIESHVKRSRTDCLLNELRGVLKLVLGEKTRCSKVNGVFSVSGGLVVLSTIKLPSDVEEIRIEAARAIHLDVDLNVPGVSVSLSAPCIRSWGHRAVVTSGSDAQELSESKAEDGRAPGASGSHGMDGLDGQNAGNVTIKCLNFGGVLNVVANGGRGSRAQDGGNGMNGAAGRDGEDAEVRSTQISPKHVLLIFGVSPDNLCSRSPGLKGTKGQDGGSGGNAGRGGRGGGAGKVVIDTTIGGNQIEREAVDGANGENGNPGRPGEGGLGGRDGRDAVVTRRIVSRLGWRIFIGTFRYYEYEWSRCSLPVDLQPNGNGGREGERAAARSEASRASSCTTAGTDHWSATQEHAQLNADIEHERESFSAVEKDKRKLDALRAQADAEMSGLNRRSQENEASRASMGRLLNNELELRQRLDAKNAEIPEERVAVTARHNLRRQMKPTSDTTTTTWQDDDPQDGARCGRSSSSWPDLLEAMPRETKTQLEPIAQQILVCFGQKRSQLIIESFIAKFTDDKKCLMDGLQLVVDCSRFSTKLQDNYADELLKVNEKLSQLKTASHFETFNWKSSGLVSNPFSRLALDSRLLALVSQQLDQRNNIKIGQLSLMEKVWPRGDLDVELAHSVRVTTPQDRNQWMNKVVRLFAALERPVDSEVEQSLNSLIRDRLALKRDLTKDLTTAHGNRERIMLVTEHGALTVEELDAVARIAAKELDRELFSLAHFTFVESFCSSKWAEIMSLPGDQILQVVDPLALFQRVIKSPFSVAPFAKRLATMGRVSVKLQLDKSDASKFSEWLQRELEALEPWIDATFAKTSVVELACQLNSAGCDRALLQLLHQLGCVTLGPEQICELAGVLFGRSAAGLARSKNEFIRLHWSCFKSEFTRDWFNYFVKFWNESHARAGPTRQHGSVDSFEVLRAKYSLWTACLSPSDAADKWKKFEAESSYEDKIKLIASDLKIACKQIKRIIVEQVNQLIKGVKVESEDILKLIDACFRADTKNESALVTAMELVQLYLDLSQDRPKNAREKFEDWKKKLCGLRESQPEFVTSAMQVMNMFELGTTDVDCERILGRRRRILEECAESMQWMAEFVHLLSESVSNRLTVVKATVDHVRHWNWLDLKRSNKLCKSAAQVFHQVTKKRQQAVASNWSELMDGIFDFLRSDKQDDLRTGLLASLTDHVYDQLVQEPNGAEWTRVRRWIQQFSWLREMKQGGHFNEAHVRILTLLVECCRLCYESALAKDLEKRSFKVSPQVIKFSFRSAFNRCKSYELFLLRVSDRDSLDHWRLEVSAVQRTLEFLLRLAESGPLLWDDTSIDKTLLEINRRTASDSRVNPDGISIVKKVLSEPKQFNRRAFVERWISLPLCFGTEDRLVRMKKAYCLKDRAYVDDGAFFTIVGRDVLTGEESGFAQLIQNERLVDEMIASGAPPSDYLSRLEDLAMNRIRTGLRNCFPESTDVQFNELSESIEAFVHPKRQQGELLEWVRWLEEEVIPSLESCPAKRGPSVKSVVAFLRDASRLPLDLGRKVTRRYRPHHWLSAVAFLSIERLLQQFKPDETDFRDGIIKKLVEWSTRTTSEVTPSVLRSLYSKILEKIDDSDENLTVDDILKRVVDGLASLDPSRIDGRALMRFLDSRLDDWPKVLHFAKMSADRTPEEAARITSIFGHDTSNRSLQFLLGASAKNSDAARLLPKLLKNLLRYPWLKDELATLASSSDVSAQESWLRKASDAKQIEHDISNASRLDLTVDEILDALKQDPMSAEQFSGSSADSIKCSVQAVWHEYEIKTKSFSEHDVESWSLNAKTEKSSWTLEEFLAVASRAVELKKGYLPRDVQLVAVLSFVQPKSDKSANRQMAQISTGEGKTLITALVAIYHVLRHWNTKERRIDVVTSSPVLAEANVEEIRWLYRTFRVQVTNNCDAKCSDDDDLKRERYNSDVIYGDLSNFMRDVLVTQYFGRDVTRNTTAGAIVVDEVDSMLLDKGENVLYISHDLPEMHDLLALFVDVWAAVNAPHAPEPADVEEFVRPRICRLVPRCLKGFSERHLSTWVASAWRARHVLVPDDAYKVDDVRDGRGAQIVIMDKETGVEQLRTEWSDGLQQFQQLKHGVKWTPPSLRAVYMSNMTYFTQFRGDMYGLTGTLGLQAECDLLSELYGVEFFKLPRSKRRFCVQDEPVVVSTKQQWLDSIVHRVERVVRDQRAALVLCENIEAANAVRDHLHRAQITSESYVSSLDDKFKVRQQTDLTPGNVIIATNLAGRGTDLKLSKALADHGGLHLIVTFVPDNARVEDQAEGRTARAGQRGSFQFVVLGDSTLEPYEQLCEMKEVRDGNERQRLTRLLQEGVPKAVLEERLFARFFSECCQQSSANRAFPHSNCSITRQCLMNRWALWLDENADSIEHANDPEMEAKVLQRFERFVENVSLKRGDPYRLAEFPSELIALGLNEKVVETEPNWCENALIELSQRTLAKDAKHPQKKEARVHLKRVRKLIEKRISDLTGCAKIVSECLEKQKQESPDESTAFEETGFADQVNNLIGLWNVHSSAVDQLLGVPLASALANYFKEDQASEVFEFIGKSSSYYVRSEHYSSKVKISFCEASKQKRVFIGDEEVPWPPFVAHCRQPLTDAIAKNLQKKRVDKNDIERLIRETENEFWEKLVQDGYVSKNATSGPCFVLKSRPDVDLTTLPSELSRLVKILPDWFKSHDGKDVDLARPALNLNDTEWELFVQWLKNKDLVVGQIKAKHKKLKAIPSVSDEPNAMICGDPLDQWAMVLSTWFSGANEHISKPDFKERATSFAKQYLGYFVDFGVIKPVKIDFSFCDRSREEIKDRLESIRSSFNSLSGIGSFADKLYDRGSKKSSELLVNNMMAAVDDHIGRLKAFEMVESSFTELRDAVRKPDDPIFVQRDECEEMESRHLGRVIKVEEKIPFDWSIVWVALIGVAQLVGAIAIPFLSSALIGEGINDLMYAFQCFQSPGSFSWKAYAKQKAQSMAITALTLGLGAVKLVAACGNSVRNAARLMVRFNGTLKGWIQMGKNVLMKCVDAVASSVVGAAVSKFLNWLKKILIEHVLEKVKSLLFSFFKTPFDKMTDLLKSLVQELVKCGKSVTEAIRKIQDFMTDDSRAESWFSTLQSKATSIVNEMLNIFDGSTSALGGLQSSFGDSFGNKAKTGHAGGIAAAADGGTVAKAIKIGKTIVDYGKEAARVKQCIDKLQTANSLCTHASDRITSRNTRMEQELVRVRNERVSSAKTPSDRQVTSDEQRQIDQFASEMPGEMQSEIMQHVVDTIQSTWLEPKFQAVAQKQAAKLTSKFAVKVGLLPPPEKLRDSQSGGGDTKSYEDMVASIGEGDPAGPVEVQNAADALGVNIKIVDETGEYTKGTGKDSFSFYSQGNPYSDAEQVQVSFTANPDGTKHITLITPDGSVFEYIPDPSQPPNRCLYEALSQACGKSTDDTIGVCKSYAKNNERARYMHDLQVDDAYSHLKVGARTRKNFVETKTDRDEFGRITKIQGVVSADKFDQGTAPNTSSRAGVPRNENLDAGHGIPKKLGGRGVKDNIVPIPASFNRGEQRMFEKEVFNEIDTGSKIHPNYRAEYNVYYKYGNELKVPSQVRDDLGMYLKLLRSAMIELINEDYADFVNLSGNLIGLDKALKNIHDELSVVLSSIKVVDESVSESCQKMLITMFENQHLEEATLLIEYLTSIPSILSTLEAHLSSVKAQETGSSSNERSLQRNACFPTDSLTRATERYNYLQYVCFQCLNTKITSIELHQRVKEAEDSLLSCLQSSFLRTFEQSDEISLSHIITMFSSLDKFSLMENLLRLQIIAPTFKSIFNTSKLLMDPFDLIGLMGEAKRFVDSKLLPIIKIFQRLDTAVSIDIVRSCVLPELTNILENQLSVVFSHKDPDLFRKVV
nr:EOG090X03KZ [Moina brachiata]